MSWWYHCVDSPAKVSYGLMTFGYMVMIGNINVMDKI